MGGGGGVNHHILNIILSTIFLVHVLQGICFLQEDRGHQLVKFMSDSVNEPLPTLQHDSARDNAGKSILRSRGMVCSV